MNLIVLLLASCLMGGCVTRFEASKEPDTEFILAQYQGQNEAEVDARRIKEGW